MTRLLLAAAALVAVLAAGRAVALRLGLLLYHRAGTAAGATFEFVAGEGHGTGAWRSPE